MNKTIKIFVMMYCMTLGVIAKAQDPQIVYANSVNSVFTIVTKNENGEQLGLGSGFIYGKGNWLVTNYHVIKGASSAVAIPANNSIEYPIAGVLIADAALDIAVLQIKGTYRTALTATLPMPKVGQKVYALGSPKGLSATFSDGIISAVRDNYLQTTAPISPGSSGGPLLDFLGKVVGMNTKQYTEGQNLNFAVPIATIDNVMKGMDGTVLSLSDANEVYTIDKEETKETSNRNETTNGDEYTNSFLLSFGSGKYLHNALLLLKNDNENPVVFVKFSGGMIKETCHFTEKKNEIFSIRCENPINVSTGLATSEYKADTFVLYEQNGQQKIILIDGTKDSQGKAVIIEVQSEKLTIRRLAEVVKSFVK